MEDLEMLECRVCRGEEETDRMLFAPCKCSGSIQWTHSDCLEEWLKHSNKSICELCSTPFQFSPLYAPNTPTHLSNFEMGTTLMKLLFRKWIPKVLRLILVAFVWIGLAPWSTSWIYRMWLFRGQAGGTGSNVNVPVVGNHSQPQYNFSNSSERWSNPQDVWSDILSGVILIVLIIFSFLALMSFADFLRFHVNNPVDNEEDIEHVPVPDDAAADANIPVENQHHEHINEPQNQVDPAGVVERGSDDEDSDDEHEPDLLNAPEIINLRQQLEDEIVNRNNLNAQQWNNNNNVPQRRNPVRNNNRWRNNARNQNNWGGEEDVENLEINLALDELLGAQGPLLSLFRNLFWLLGFNGAYLGLFAFLPYTLGSSVLSLVSGREGVMGTFSCTSNWCVALKEANAAAISRGDCLQFVDLLTIVLGYSTVSISILIWYTSANYMSNSFAFLRQPFFDWLHLALRCLQAIVKVSGLLLLKMILLPILLGIGLNLSSSLFFSTVSVSSSSSISVFRSHWSFVWNNMLGNLLIHWVLGITFMLFVTVSVLQLREVVHPQLLATIIRPQEAHPDLMRTLLEEPITKHARRMVLSLAIYAMLLVLLMYLPVRLVNFFLPRFGLVLQFNYFLPDLQVPLELLLVHMVVLAMLERYKNDIGTLQYVWMTYMCEKLDLVEFLLPRINLSSIRRRRRDRTNKDVNIKILAPPPLHFHPQNDIPPPAQRVKGMRYLPWPEDSDVRYEYPLLPRSKPDYCWLRVIFLCCCGWSSMVFVIGLAMLTPLFLGRLSLSLTSVLWHRHDPFCLAAGSFLSYCFIRSILICRQIHRNWTRIQNSIKTTISTSRNTTTINSNTSTTTTTTTTTTTMTTTHYWLKVAIAWYGTLPCLIGLMSQNLLQPTFLTDNNESLTARIVQVYCFGNLLLHTSIWMCSCYWQPNFFRRNNNNARNVVGRNNNNNVVVPPPPPAPLAVEGEGGEENEEVSSSTDPLERLKQGLVTALEQIEFTMSFEEANLNHNNEEKWLNPKQLYEKVLLVLLKLPLEMFIFNILLKVVLPMGMMIIHKPSHGYSYSSSNSSSLSSSSNHSMMYQYQQWGSFTFFLLRLFSFGKHMCHEKVVKGFEFLHTSIRDDRYLIGRQLHNFQRPQVSS